MACNNAKSMRFRVYECKYPVFYRTFDAPSSLHHNPLYHIDTGKEFTITAPDDTLEPSIAYNKYYGRDQVDLGISEDTIAMVMFKKIYGFAGSNFAMGYRVTQWGSGGKFTDGTLHGIWYIKRVL